MDKEKCSDSYQTELSERLIKLEWQAFDKVQNIGRRAGCQDDWETFLVMRKSQYMTWTVEMLESYIMDFEIANSLGRNLIAEKYGWMMESTDKESFLEIKDSLPVISAEKRNIIEGIVAIQVGWMEEWAEKYPKAAMRTRSIHTGEDSLYNTSYETYLRGELSTYSDRTLELYGRFVVGFFRDGKNLAEAIIGNSAKLYGYFSMENLEKGLR